MSEWFYLGRDGQSKRATQAELISLARNGQLKSDSLIHDAASGQWIPASQVSWLFPNAEPQDAALDVVGARPPAGRKKGRRRDSNRSTTGGGRAIVANWRELASVTGRLSKVLKGTAGLLWAFAILSLLGFIGFMFALMNSGGYGDDAELYATGAQTNLAFFHLYWFAALTARVASFGMAALSLTARDRQAD